MTIEELRRARLAAKLEAMGGIGSYAEAKRKAVYVSDETQQRLDFVVRRIGLRGASILGYVERVLREHLDGYKDSIEQWRKL